MADVEQSASVEPSASAKRSINKRNQFAIIALIVCLGAFLRLWGITWGLPDTRHPLATFHPDELVDFRASQQVDILVGKLDIGFYNYGAFYFYLVDVAQNIGQAYGGIPSIPARPANSPPLSAMEEAQRVLPETRGIYLAGRIVSAVMGTLTIPVLFCLGRRLFDVRIGLTSALFYAILPLAVVHAHFFTVDVGATLFVSLALLYAARLLDDRSWKTYLLAGAFTGLAAATKYSALLVIIAPLAAHFSGQSNDSTMPKFKYGLYVLAAGVLAAFLIGCPGPILNWEAFWNGLPNYPNSGVRYELFEHPRQGHGLLFVNTGPGWWYHLVISLRYGLGMPMLFIAFMGVFSAIGAKTRQDKMLLWFIGIFYLITGASGVRFARYMIPLFPALCVLSARHVWEIKPRQVLKHGVPLAFGVLTIATLAYTVSLVHAMAVRDPRDAAADYLNTHAAQGASVAFAKTPWFFSPPLSPWFGEISPVSRAKCTETTRFRFLLPANGTEFDLAVLSPSPDFVVISNIETTNEMRLNMPGPKNFMAAIPHDLVKHEFDPPALFDMAFSGDLIPDDLLYILPKVTVYQKP